MGILDDLKSQAEQKNKPAGEQLSSAGAEEFYRTHVKQRMIKANDFLTQLVNQLNELKLVIKAEYPFKSEGKTVTLLQRGYKAYSDHITDPRQITLSYTCILANPSTYDVRGRGPALALGELLERYQFKHDKLEARDQNRMVIGARFKLQGPLQVKCVLQFDEAKQIIKLLLTNIVGPGTSQYNLKPEQLDETFMDRLGKYLLRKEANLFQEEISDDAKAMLRKKLQQEQQQREAELRALEEQRKAEEAARKQNSTTEQLKKAVSQTVAENREKLKKVMDEQVREKGEKLKNMFNKLKNRTGFEKTTEQISASQAVNTTQSAKPTGNPAVQGQPPVNRQAGQAASAPQNATRPKSPAVQSKPTPPKVFVSSASNPFLKPEDFEPVTKSGEEQTEDSADTKTPAAQLPADTATPATAKTPSPTMPPAAPQARPTVGSSASAAKTANPFLQTKAAAVQAETKKPTVQSPAQIATPTTPTMSPATAKVRPTSVTNPSEAKTDYQFAQRNRSKVQVETKKPMAQSPARTATPATQTPMTSPAAEAKPVAVPDVSVAKTTNPPVQSKPPAAPDEPKLSLESIALDSEYSSPAVPFESGLSLESTGSDVESSSPAAPSESGLSLESTGSDVEASYPAAPSESALSLEPNALEVEASSPAAPSESALSLEPNALEVEASSPAATVESALSLESTALDVEASSPAVPGESGLSLKSNASHAESSPLATKTEEPQPDLSSDLPALSLEDELARDLARIMENEQQQPLLKGEKSEAPPSTTDELDLDLSSPDALEIYFEDTDKASDPDNSELKNSKL